MSTMRTIGTATTDLACRAIGRRRVIRAARLVLRRARFDVPNDPRTNGESPLQEWMLATFPSAQVVHVADVGANVGRWSQSMLAAARGGRPACGPRLARVRAVVLHVCVLVGSARGGVRGPEPGRAPRSVRLRDLARSRAGCRDEFAAPAAPAACRQRHGRGAHDDPRRPRRTGRAAAIRPGQDRHRGPRPGRPPRRSGVARRPSHIGRAVRVKPPLGLRALVPLRRFRAAGAVRVPAREADATRCGALSPLGYPSGDLRRGKYVACASGVAGRLPSVTWWKSDE